MKNHMTMCLGLLGLFCGIVLLLESTKQLRADPKGGGGVCPNEDISQGTKDCVTDTPCEGDHGQQNSCLTTNHYQVVTFPKECKEAKDGSTKWRLGDVRS